MKNFAIATFLGVMLVQPGAALAGDVWITNVKLVSPEKLDRIEAGSVLVRDGRIASVQRGGKQVRPAGAQRIDGKGYYLAPGLIDSHVHLHGVPGMSLDQPKTMPAMAAAYFKQLPRSFLYHGFTTVIDLALADRAIIDNFVAAPEHPDLVHCGEPLVLANGYPMSYVAPALRFETFRNFIYDPAQKDAIPGKYAAQDYTPAAGMKRIKDDGGICVKTHFERGFGAQSKLPVMNAATFGEVRKAAGDAGLTLVTHANSLEGQQFAVDGGAAVLAHGMWRWGSLDKAKGMPPEVAAVLDKVVEQRIGYQATTQVLHGLRAFFDPEYLKDPALGKVIPKDLMAWLKTPEGQWFKKEVGEDEPDADVLAGFDVPLDRLRRVIAYLAARDANFVLGSDTPASPTYGNLPGLNGYLEMQHLHQAGLSLRQVFEAATINNARTFKIDGRVGTIEVGKDANLLLMQKSPLQDITAYDSIDSVWVRGRRSERASLAAN
jgi:dihydroorotase-like cyclic amidohydrolase